MVSDPRRVIGWVMSVTEVYGKYTVDEPKKELAMIEKYGVDESSNQDPKKMEKAASEGCPKCGQKVQRHGNVVLCPNCGSEPFEADRPK